MNWTDERVEKLTKLWADGLSASQIAAQLGGVSRNAVIGKVHRLNLPGRAKSPVPSSNRSKRTVTPGRQAAFPAQTRTMPHTHSAAPSRPAASRGGAATALKQDLVIATAAQLDMRAVEEVVVPISRRLSLIQLSERTCKWPIGDPLQEEFHFCGNDSGDSSPYCTYHSKLAFQPSAERRRAR